MYSINGNNRTLTLTLTATSQVKYIAIYDGYDNRDDGTYTIGYTNAGGTNVTLGTYTVASTNINSSITNTDDILLTLTTPVTATAITIGFTNGTDTQNTNSFDDIQVFAAPEPGTYAMALLGLGALLSARALRRRRA